MRSLIDISSRTGAQIKIPRSSGLFSEHPISTEDDRVQLYKLYLGHINAIPRVETFRDLFRLCNHKYVSHFREKLEEWTAELNEGNAAALRRMRREFELAVRDLKVVSALRAIGGILSIVALPTAIAGLLTHCPWTFCSPRLVQPFGWKAGGVNVVRTGSSSADPEDYKSSPGLCFLDLTSRPPPFASGRWPSCIS